jgi:hypothetical protein
MFDVRTFQTSLHVYQWLVCRTVQQVVVLIWCLRFYIFPTLFILITAPPLFSR